MQIVQRFQAENEGGNRWNALAYLEHSFAHSMLSGALFTKQYHSN
jgi:hypothetical protein